MKKLNIIYEDKELLVVDKEEGLRIMEEEFQKVIDNFGGREKISLKKRLQLTAKRLSEIPRKMELDDAKFVTVTGEIYVRNDHFARRNIEGFFAETPVKGVKAEVLTEKMQAHNTFDAPEVVKTKAFDGVKAEGNKISLSMPARSVMHIEVTV